MVLRVCSVATALLGAASLLGCQRARGTDTATELASASGSSETHAPSIAGGGGHAPVSPPPVPAGDPEPETTSAVKSHDGKRTASVRGGTNAKPVILLGADVLVDPATAVVDNKPEAAPLAQTASLTSLAFSSDDKTLYFLADGWVTSMALYAVDVATRKVRFVNHANEFRLIDRCSDTRRLDQLVLFQHGYFDPMPSHAVDWFFLVDAQGKRQAIVGPEEENVDRFLAGACGIGKSPAAAAKVAVPIWLRKPFQCGSVRLEYHPIPLADGTSFEAVFARDPSDPSVPMDMTVEDAIVRAKRDCPTLVSKR